MQVLRDMNGEEDDVRLVLIVPFAIEKEVELSPEKGALSNEL